MHFYPIINSFAADRADSPDRVRQIVSVTRFSSGHKHKGGKELLKAIGPGMKGHTLAIIIGAGQVDPQILQLLSERAIRHDVQLRFLSRLTDREKFHEIKRSKLMLFLSQFEGFGYPPVEAQYCETPCIVYDLPVLREVSGDGLLYVPRGDEQALQTAIESVLVRGFETNAEIRQNVARLTRFEERAAELSDLLQGLILAEYSPRVSSVSPTTYFKWRIQERLYQLTRTFFYDSDRICVKSWIRRLFV
jgi:glycosyltransferase involved in cell wall biosynthesis